MHMRWLDVVGREVWDREIAIILYWPDIAPPKSGEEALAGVRLRIGEFRAVPEREMVVECCCFLINIIDGHIEMVPFLLWSFSYEKNKWFCTVQP